MQKKSRSKTGKEIKINDNSSQSEFQNESAVANDKNNHQKSKARKKQSKTAGEQKENDNLQAAKNFRSSAYPTDHLEFVELSQK